jgi:hypothetical protein
MLTASKRGGGELLSPALPVLSRSTGGEKVWTRPAAAIGVVPYDR